jgi:hypothetical protein
MDVQSNGAVIEYLLIGELSSKIPDCSFPWLCEISGGETIFSQSSQNSKRVSTLIIEQNKNDYAVFNCNDHIADRKGRYQDKINCGQKLDLVGHQDDCLFSQSSHNTVLHNSCDVKF